MPIRFRRLLALPVLPVLALGMNSATAAPAPVYGSTGGPGTYTEQNIGSTYVGGAASYRIPALADLGDGIVLAAWDGRPGSAADAPNPNSIVLRRSTDYGTTWSDYTHIKKGHLGDATTQKYGYSDPSFVVDSVTGAVYAFFVYSKDQGWHYSQYGNDITKDRTITGAVVVESKDKGLTWSEPRDITPIVKPGTSKTSPKAGDVKAVFATSGEGIQMKYGQYAGRLVQQFVGKVRTADGKEVVQAYSVYSDDHGVTWKRGDFVGASMDENKTVELSDGRLMLNSRDSANSGYRKVAISSDGGQTWGPITLDTELPDPTNNAAITRMYPKAPHGSADAKKLIFTNSNNNANYNRVNLSARVSCDDGQTWPGLRQIKSGFGAYSSTTALSNGKFGVLYEASYGNDMRYGTFDEAWLNVVCAPMNVDKLTVAAGQTASVPVTITNQEAQAVTGTITLADTGSFTGATSEKITLDAGQTRTVKVNLTTAATASTGKVDAVFTAENGKQSRFTFPVEVGASTTVFGATVHSASAPARDIATSPYTVGEKITYTFSVTNTADEAVSVVPTAGNFDAAGYLPTSTPNCRYLNLAAKGTYTCSTATHTVTQEDIDRGYFTPEMTFTVTSRANDARTTTVTHTGEKILLKPARQAPSITVTGRVGTTAAGYAVGDTVGYTFRVTNTSPYVTTVTPVSGSFDRGFMPTSAPNCRWRNLPANGAYNCTTAQHLVTAEDLARGYFIPTATFSVVDNETGAKTEVTYTGDQVALSRR